MSIASLLSRTLKQTAVYWGSPVNDGYAGHTFDDPVEIACRWEDKGELVRDASGAEFVSRSIVYVLQDVDTDGYLFLGVLTDLSSAEEGDPEGTDGAYLIKKFDKSPSLSGSEFVRKAYL